MEPEAIINTIPVSPALKDKTILVVEDEPPLQDAIQTKLKSLGINHMAAMTAEDALLMISKHRPDIIWLDLLMPGMGGFAFLEKLRHDSQYKDIPVVIVSVSGSPEKIRRAFELNVVDFLIKSQYRLEDIIKRITSFIA